MNINVIVQARMGSARLPGKVMLPLGDRLVIDHVLARAHASHAGPVIVAIPASEENDPLASHLKGETVVRGPEDHVALRFAMACKRHPCEAFIRICADSPFIDPGLIAEIAKMMTEHHPEYASNRQSGFPPGQQVEAVAVETFMEAVPRMNEYEREHVMPYFYRRPGQFTCRQIRQYPERTTPHMVLDTREDYERLQRCLPVDGLSWTEIQERAA